MLFSIRFYESGRRSEGQRDKESLFKRTDTAHNFGSQCAHRTGVSRDYKDGFRKHFSYISTNR